MTNLNDKVWFVYMGDHHEGPFSLAEMESKIQAAQITVTNYVWKEGMADWKMMTEVPECGPLVSRGSGSPTAPSTPAVETQSTSQTSRQAVSPEDSLVTDDVGNDTTTQEILPDQLRLQERKENEGLPVQPEGETQLPELEVPTSTESVVTRTEAAPQTQSSVVSAPEKVELVSEVKAVPDSGVIDRLKNTMTTSFGSRLGNLFSKKPKNPVNPHTDGAVGAASVARSSSSSRMTKVLFLLLVLGGGAYSAHQLGFLDRFLGSRSGRATSKTFSNILDPAMNKVGEWLPFLGQWMSPIPKIDDVSEADYESLKTVAKADLATGVKVAVALSQKNLKKPTFHVVSNLPDGARFEIFVQGKEGTLLNQLDYEGRSSAVTQQHLGKSVPLRSAKGKKLPRGEYTVYLYESQRQSPPVTQALSKVIGGGVSLPAPLPSGRKAFVKQTFFLGGKKDQAYFSRLNQYHKKLKKRSDQEMSEISNYSATIVSQYKGSVSKFLALSKGRKTRRKTRSWGRFSKNWKKLDQGLRKPMEKWSDDALSKGYFHQNLYHATKTAATDVSALHRLQNTYFVRRKLSRSYSKELLAAVEKTKKSIEEMQKRIDQTRKLPPAANGMPRRLSGRTLDTPAS